MKLLPINMDYVRDTLVSLLQIPSPTGYTDRIVHFVGGELKWMGINFELTRRGAIRADLYGRQTSPDRAIVSHVDTLGAMVKNLKPNGRLEIVPIGFWSSRFAEGARVTVFTDDSSYRGTVLPNKASGHTFNEEIDSQPCTWENVEVRVDERVHDIKGLMKLGIHTGDYVAVDSNPEITSSGFINARHLDNKCGVAIMLGMARAVKESQIKLPVSCHLLFTISEEVGVGASAGIQRDVAEMVTIDNATPAQGQNSNEYDVTVAMKDSSGPFDYHLTHKLIDLCTRFEIPFQRDVFKYYRCDSAAALEAGNDLRTALLGFGADASHGWERTHFDCMHNIAQLLSLYVQTPLTYERDKDKMGPLKGFPTQPH